MSLDSNGVHTGIGADADLYQESVRRRCDKLRGKLFAYMRDNNIIGSEWLDVGAGKNYMRDILPPRVISDNETDLDSCPYKFQDKSFDLTTSFEVLEHLYNPLFHLRELRRVIKDNGSLILVTPNDYSLIYKAEHLLSRKYRPHFHQFSERDLRDILSQAGFRIMHMEKFFKSRSGTLARISRNGFFVHAKR